ncbi:nucleolar pre-ribosomal-associated protein 1 [Protopterus annectens]|uniref:nucleolar pre-ribosomal-associated protein 1 n=1 Tax=Protopterus annectens TaxID=7888 RepID=UPI001CFA8DA0|nr:nucleolar pre-ribosomal-associated protein 1 [Protopterus annectens]
MGHKRKKSESEKDSDNPSKKPKTVEPEFTGTQFKSMLKDSQTLTKGMETFISLAKKLPSADLYDVVEGYIKISMECAEIFKLLDGEKRSEKEMVLIFESLEAILLRTASDLLHFSIVGVNIVKKLISNYMKSIYAALYSESYRFCRICLKLLSAMVTQGPDSARDVFSHFDFNHKLLPGLVKKRDAQGRPDVRMAYIQFALSFLISGDNILIGQVLELKGFISDIFSTGLREDRISIINLLLSTLKTKVVQNKTVSKTQKVRFFAASVLNHIASLYRWNGIVDVSTEDIKNAPNLEEKGKMMIREIVHNFLMELCCSLKHGINFFDPSLGTVGRGGNLVLLRFLLGLKTATEDEMVADLVVNILKVCPDLLQRYFKETQYSFVPRLKSAWLDNVKLLRKIYEAQPEFSKAFNTSEFIPFPRLLSMVMITTVPPVCTKAMFSQGLNLPNKVVKQTTLSLLVFILKRALCNIEHCLAEEVWQSSEIYTPTGMAEFCQQYREALSKLLPDMNSIVAVWQSLLRKDKKDEDDINEEKKEESKENMEIADAREPDQPHSLDDAETTLLKAVLLQVMCLYQKVIPHIVTLSTFDFSKLLKGIVSEKGIREEVPPVLQYHILQLALELPANKFSWFKVQDISDAEKHTGEKSVFYLMLKMFTTSKTSHLKMSTKLLIIKVLMNSGIFQYTWKELEVWLKHLDSVIEEKQEAVIQFLESVLIKLVCNPYPYTDKAAELVQEASMLEASLGGQESDAASISVAHIDDVLDMVDVIVEGSEGLDEEIGFTLNDELILQTFPFSGVVPAAMEARNKMFTQGTSRTDEIDNYLVSVLTDILHAQRDPLALCLLLQFYDKDLEMQDKKVFPVIWCSQFYKYYSLWIPQQVKEHLFEQIVAESRESSSELPVCAPFPCLLKNAYERGGHTILEEKVKENLREAISSLSLDILPLAAKHIMLYIRTTINNFNKCDKTTSIGMLNLFMEMLKFLIHRGQELSGTDEVQQQKADFPSDDCDLFLDVDSVMAGGPTKDKVLEDLLVAIFKHPVPEQWFLALDLQSPPPHCLNPVSVKLLSNKLNTSILELLRLSMPLLQCIHRVDIASMYFQAITKSVLKEVDALNKAGSRGSASNKKSQVLQGLEELHIYMDQIQLQEVISSMLQLHEECLTVQRSAEEKGSVVMQLSHYGDVLVSILMENYGNVPKDDKLVLSASHVKGLSTLLQFANSEGLEHIILGALQKEPVFSHVIGLKVLTLCLERRTEISLSVAEFLLKHSMPHVLHFELWCLDPGNMKYLKRNLEALLPLLSVYLKQKSTMHFARSKEVSMAVMVALKEGIWKKLTKKVLADEAFGEIDLHLEVICGLIQDSDSRDELTCLIDQFPEVLEKTENYKWWDVSDPIAKALEGSLEMKDLWKNSLLKACLRWLVSTYNSNKEQEDELKKTEASMLSHLSDLMHSVSRVEAVDWNNFVKTGLKYRYKDCTFLNTLNNLIQSLYENEGSSSTLVQLPMIHMMVTNHSMFLQVMLWSREEQLKEMATREAIVDLLLSVVQRCPSLCDKNHFAVLLGAYGATLDTTDQKILLLLQTYEKNNVSLADFRLLLWGPAAVEHHKTRKSLGKSLWQQPSTEEVLALLDSEKMHQTILHFPQQRHILPEEGKEPLFTDKNIKDLHNLYDPCFLLPLFSALLKPESVVDCHKFVEVNALGFTVTALSSYDPKVRAAAYHVLGAFHSHLEGARFREKSQLLYLMDTVKNGVRQQNFRFTFSLAVYVAKVSQQMLRPEEHMYMRINQFLLLHQYLDLRKVPGFYKLFYSFDLEHKVEREWLLNLLSDGLKDKHCYELYDHQRIFHVLLAFFSSPLCDETAQLQVLEVLQCAAQITKAAYELIRDHSLLTWMLHILEKRFIESDLLSRIISLVQTLWTTNLGDKEAALARDSASKIESDTSHKFLPLQIVNEFLFILLRLIKHIRTSLDVSKLCQYFGTLRSVLKHRSFLMKTYKEMKRFTVNVHALSHKDILLILQKWNGTEKDLCLQDALQTIAHKYKVTELLRIVKERNKPKLSARVLSRNTRSKVKENVNEDANRSSDIQEFCISKCKSYLNSICTYWVPVFPSEDQQLHPTGDEDGSIRIHSDIKAEVLAATCLVARWVVRSAINCDLTVVDLDFFLNWLQTSILPHETVVQELLKDPIVKSNLLQLYNQACYITHEDYCTIQSAAVFSQVMLELIKYQSLSKDGFLDTVVQPMCLAALNEEDMAMKVARLCLLSLYIQDLWLETDRPEMFLSYVRMVLRSEIEKQEDDEQQTPRRKGKKMNEAIVALCKDISELVMDL